MCFFLYAALYGDVSGTDYQAVQDKYVYQILLGTKHDVKMAVKAGARGFRLTDWQCDFDSPVGRHNPNDPIIAELCSLITELLALPGAEQAYLCKTWIGKQNKKEIKQKLADADLAMLLADLKENCLYCLAV